MYMYIETMSHIRHSIPYRYMSMYVHYITYLCSCNSGEECFIIKGTASGCLQTSAMVTLVRAVNFCLPVFSKELTAPGRGVEVTTPSGGMDDPVLMEDVWETLSNEAPVNDP